MAKQEVKIAKKGNFFHAYTHKELGEMKEKRRKAGDKNGEKMIQKLLRTSQGRDDGDLLVDFKKGLIPKIIPGDGNG